MKEEDIEILKQVLKEWKKRELIEGIEGMNNMGKSKLFALISNIISAILGAVGGYLGAN